MLRTDLQTMHEVMEAFYEGRTVQFRMSPDTGWGDVTRPQPAWDPAGYYYRIKPEPRVFKLWRPVYPERGEKGPWQVASSTDVYINPVNESVLVREVMEDEQ